MITIGKKQHLLSVNDVCWPDGGPSKTLSIGTDGNNGNRQWRVVKDGLPSVNDVCWPDGDPSKNNVDRYRWYQW